MNKPVLNAPWLPTQLATVSGLLFILSGTMWNHPAWILLGLAMFFASALLYLKARDQVGAAPAAERWLPTGLAGISSFLFIVSGTMWTHRIWILMGLAMGFVAALLYVKERAQLPQPPAAERWFPVGLACASGLMLVLAGVIWDHPIWKVMGIAMFIAAGLLYVRARTQTPSEIVPPRKL